ncbi:neuronal acetylcholine receptor subunit alpha-7-like [Saccostrea echinata]|uniref:neuronal acetylcholine receptor subunit alpha-7-like n=1 Tax=Saccostrea echinata TaxID=191078 RepID=UPI002A821542|nr:neuronal acetylcholine receptor subunit alpha-7-like [Saccostrea echinata]
MILIVFVLSLIFLHVGEAANRTDIENLYTKLLLGVSNTQLLSDIRPALYTEVTGSLSLLSISGLDEVSGTFSTMVNLALIWNDERLLWSPADYNNLANIVVPQTLVWTPSMIMRNSANKVKRLGLEDNVVTISSDGTVTLNIGDYLETVCSFDVTHFPFDHQKCEILFIPWIYNNDSVGLKQRRSDVDLNLYSSNGMWNIGSTTATVNYIVTPSTGNIYAELKYTINLERRSSYFVLSIFIPVIMLLLLNSVVFILPTDSGERVGYSVTCLLALAVFLTLTADVLPKTSDPLSILSCFMMLLVLTSAVICLTTIISVWLHHKPENSPMPIYLKKFTFLMLCKGRKIQNTNDTSDRSIVSVETPKLKTSEFKGVVRHAVVMKKTQAKETNKAPLKPIKEKEDDKRPLENEKEEDPYTEMTWKKFSELFNFLCFVVTLSFTGILGFIYVLIARGNL